MARKIPDLKAFVDGIVTKVYGSSDFIEDGARVSPKRLDAVLKSPNKVIPADYSDPGKYYFIMGQGWSMGILKGNDEYNISINYSQGLPSNVLNQLADHLLLKRASVQEPNRITGNFSELTSIGDKLTDVLRAGKVAIELKKQAEAKLTTDLEMTVKQYLK